MSDCRECCKKLEKKVCRINKEINQLNLRLGQQEGTNRVQDVQIQQLNTRVTKLESSSPALYETNIEQTSQARLSVDSQFGISVTNEQLFLKGLLLANVQITLQLLRNSTTVEQRIFSGQADLDIEFPITNTSQPGDSIKFIVFGTPPLSSPPLNVTLNFRNFR